MKNEVKQKVDYADQKLEAVSAADLQNIEELRKQKILAGTIEEQVIGGEISIKVDKGVNLAEINGKEMFAFAFEMPQYSKKAALIPTGMNVLTKMQNPETGKFGMKVRLAIENKNLHMYSDALCIRIFKRR